MRFLAPVAVCTLGAALAGCVVNQASLRCPPSLGPPILVFNVFFGRSVMGRGEVTEREWNDFVSQVITPKLPHGFTVFNANGMWLNPENYRTIREHTKVLLVALPETSDSVGVVGQIRNEYQVQFRQHSVAMAVQPACGDF
ncbi:MAG: DUF3574 domain-containing protein [Acetobacteraceae bacterium]|nr:DUF3574 domain-containing protein [Acetobacteraceae bacterium]